MMNFLFWNIGRQATPGLVATAARQNDVDVLILAECAIEPWILVTEMRATGSHYSMVKTLASRFSVLTRFPTRWLPAIAELGRTTIHQLQHPLFETILVAISHLPSKLHQPGTSQVLECVRLAQDIAETERRVGHTRTILVGDLNMDPFEEGVVVADGLHAVMDRRIAARNARTVGGRIRPFFYNPMWSCFGDTGHATPGTYFYDGGGQLNYYWHTFDQLLIRPNLLPALRPDGLRVLTQVEDRSLLTVNGRPDAEGASDHLPIFFSLHLTPGG